MKKPAKKPATLPIRVQFGRPYIYVAPGPPDKYYSKCDWDVWLTWGDGGQIVERATITIISSKRFSTLTAAMRAARALAKRQPVVVTERSKP